MKADLDEFCPCCGYNTFEKEDRLQYSICPICFWEDDPIQFDDQNYEGGANSVSLVRARLNFEKFGACENEMKNHARKPTSKDLRKPGL